MEQLLIYSKTLFDTLVSYKKNPKKIKSKKKKGLIDALNKYVNTKDYHLWFIFFCRNW